MIYVGIDIAKLNHFASAISSDDEILMEPFQFSNDADSFHMLVSRLNFLESDNIIIGLESTAHYGDNLVRYLVASSFKVCVLNPIKTSSMRKNNIRKTKTDKVDTYIIAKTLMMQDSYRFVTFYVGANDSALSIQITQTIAQIELLDSQLKKGETEMTEIMKFHDSVIMTIPGIGYINGGIILGEIGDIHRFMSPSKLLAFAGLDPSVYQFGNFQARRTRLFAFFWCFFSFHRCF